MLPKDWVDSLTDSSFLRYLHYLGDLVWEVDLKYVSLVSLQYVQVLEGRGRDGARGEGEGGEGGKCNSVERKAVKVTKPLFGF